MNKLNLTTKLNLQIVGIVFLFMLVVMVYNQWVILQESKNNYVRQLAYITEFIVKRMPDESFVDIAERKGAGGKPMQSQVLAVNEELQPILSNMLETSGMVKYALYSKQHGRIVAVGPEFELALLVEIDPARFQYIYDTEKPIYSENKTSILWYGAPILYHIRPILHDGEVIGHAFACVNLNKLYSEMWNRAINTLFGGVVAMLFVIVLFQEVFIRLKKDLELFAGEILKGTGKDFESELPELTPIFKYISEQTESMTRLDRLNVIGEMAASIGHEVRNPMTTVRGYLQYLGEKKSMEAHKSQFTLMIEELDRANSIITEFLSLAKNKAMDFKPMNLNKVLTEIYPLLQADALRYNCQVEMALGEIKETLLDENSIRQLVLNMVRNAIEAMPGGGKIIIKTIQKEEDIVLTICDQGQGIPKELLNQLGTPFFTTKEKGTGLGLAVCFRIAQRHNANIAVKSEAASGTAFTITFRSWSYSISGK